jgi:NADH:ubiquinone reductase (H+-translocating)
MSSDKNIVIVGGGFAGTALARALGRQLPAGHRVVLVSEESYTTFNPMLAEVVGASVFPEHVVAPIRPMLRQGGASQFIMGRVSGVDLERRRLRANTLAGLQDLAYEHLVLAFGTRANLDLVPGLAQHALPLKLVGDAMFIRNRVLQRVARIELETDPAARRRLGHFIVIGGGFSGVEVAGALADFLRSAVSYYPRVKPQELQVTLIESADRLLLDLPPSLGLAAARSMQLRGIHLLLKSRAASVDPAGVLLDNGETLAGATVICTIGTKPNPLVQGLGLPTQRGRIQTAADMSVSGSPQVWAIGDCALVPNGTAGQFAPPTAQFAIAQARALARNIAARIEGRPTQGFSHASRGMMATTGHLKGVAQLFGLRVHGLPAWLLWRAYYLLLMPTMGRKLRIFVEWTWSMFFAADVTHLRFIRTAEADADSPPETPARSYSLLQPLP